MDCMNRREPTSTESGPIFGPYAAHLVPAQLGHRVPASTANFQLFFKDFDRPLPAAEITAEP